MIVNLPEMLYLEKSFNNLFNFIVIFRIIVLFRRVIHDYTLIYI